MASSQTIPPKTFFTTKQVLQDIHDTVDAQEEQEKLQKERMDGGPTTSDGRGGGEAKSDTATKRKQSNTEEQPDKKKKNKPGRKSQDDERLTRKLIELVQPWPILYDTTRKDYKDSTRKGQIWASIATLLQSTGEW